MAVKWDLDLWYEMWERAGSQGLDTWYPIAGEPREGEPSVGGKTGPPPADPCGPDERRPVR